MVSRSLLYDVWVEKKDEIRRASMKSQWHNGTFVPSIFYPIFFSFAIESYVHIYKTDFCLVSAKNITFKSSYNWFKIYILRPPQSVCANHTKLTLAS